MKEAPPRAVQALFGFTFVTGLIDAASVLGLGHVFVANMTGNVVFAGFSLVGQGDVSFHTAAAALFGFVAGAIFGGRCVGRGSSDGPRAALATDAVLLVAAGCLQAARLRVPVDLLVVSVAAAMGVRTAFVRWLAVPDLTTTVLTQTIAGVAADSSLAGGKNPRMGRRLAAIACVLGGALVGALILSRAPDYVLLCAALLESIAAVTLHHSLFRESSGTPPAL